MISQPSNVAKLRAAWRAVTDDADAGQLSVERPAPDAARVYVHGMIGGWRMNAGAFVQAVHALDVPELHVHINSPGGFVWDAVSMYEALIGHRARVVSHIDGVAASAASFLALAADRVEIAAAGRVMVHDVQTVAYGSPDEVRAAADLGDALSDDLAGLYAQRAGGKRAAWRAAMRATTWYSSQQAVDAGLAHQVARHAPAGEKSSGGNLTARTLRARAAVALGGVSK